MPQLTITIDAKTLQSVNSAFQQLESQIRSLRGQLQETSRASERLGVSFGQSLSGVASKLRDVEGQLRKFSTVATAFSAGVVGGLLKVGSQAIATEKAFDRLAGSTEKASRLLKELDEISARSVFSRQGTIQTAQRLLAQGISPDDIIPTIQAIQAAVAATGNITQETVSRITTAFAQIATKGKLQMEEARQLAEAGVPVFKILQRELRLTDEQMRELMEGKRVVGAGQALRALVQGLTRDFAGLHQAMVDTPVGQISNFFDNLSRIGIQLGGVFASAIAPALREVNERLSEYIASGRLERALPAITDAARALGGAFLRLLDAVVRIADAFGSLPRPIQSAVATMLVFAGPASLVLVGLSTMLRLLIGIGNALGIVATRAMVAGGALVRSMGIGGTGVTGAGLAGAASLLGRLFGVAGLALTPSVANAGEQLALVMFEVERELIRQLGRPLRSRAEFEAVRRRAQELTPVVAQRLGRLTPLPSASAIHEAVRAVQAEQRAIQEVSTPIDSSRLFGDLPSMVSERGGAGGGRAGDAAIDLLSGQVRLGQMRIASRLRSVRELLDAGRIEEARRALQSLRREVESLVRLMADELTRSLEQQMGRRLTGEERSVVVQHARMQALAEIESLERRITDEIERQAQESEARRLEMLRQREVVLREIYEMESEMLRRVLREASPQERLRLLPRLQQRMLAPLSLEMLLGDDAQRRRAQLRAQAVIEEIRAEQMRAQEEIAQLERARAMELYQVQQARLELERERLRVQAESAVLMAESELESARDTLQVLQQQGAERNLLRQANQQVLEATRRRLEAERASLEANRQILQGDLERLRVLSLINALLGNPMQAIEMQRQSLSVERQVSQIDAALRRVEMQMKNVSMLADEHNPFVRWRFALMGMISDLNTMLADALLGFRRFGDGLKDWVRSLGREFLRILLSEILNPLYQVLAQVARLIGAAILRAVGVQNAANGVGGALAGAGAGLLGGIAVAGGVGYLVGQALGLNPVGSAVGAGLGFVVGGPIGALIGGLLGGLFGRRRQAPPPVQFVPIGSPTRTEVTQHIHLHLAEREVSRAIVQSAY